MDGRNRKFTGSKFSTQVDTKLHFQVAGLIVFLRNNYKEHHVGQMLPNYLSCLFELSCLRQIIFYLAFCSNVAIRELEVRTKENQVMLNR